MSEWKDLELRCLPDLTEDYEFMKYEEENDSWYNQEIDNVEAVCEVDAGESIRYRKPEPKQPTHEEIIEKLIDEIRDGGSNKDVKNAVLYLLESAIIPPETK